MSRPPVCRHMGLAAILACGTAIVPHASGAGSGEALTPAWIDTYYADYSAMSAAPTGPAMDRWLAHYAAYAFFEDPTAGLSAVGHDPIRQPYVQAFTGPLGPVRWTIARRVIDGPWAAVEGWVDGSQRGKPLRVRFTTWLKVIDGKIVHQIDYVDYGTWRRQAAGEETGAAGIAHALRGGRIQGSQRDRALRVSEEFYGRYEALAAAASAPAVERHSSLLTEDFTLEDPAARLFLTSRTGMRTLLEQLIAKAAFGTVHWEIDRRISDGEWVAVEGVWRGVYQQRPFATRFATWLRVRDARIAHQIDYLDYATFTRMTSPAKDGGK